MNPIIGVKWIEVLDRDSKLDILRRACRPDLRMNRNRSLSTP